MSETPRPPRVNFDALPEGLHDRPFLLWRYETRDGKPTKVPYQANGHRASSTDPGTWTDYPTARRLYLAALDSPRPFSGVGIALDDDDDLLAVDLDGCLHPDGTLEDWAEPVIALLGTTYAEVTPSGAGLRLFVRGEMPVGSSNKKRLTNFVPSVPGPKDPEFEWYAGRGRYVTVTGQTFRDAPKIIGTPAPAALAAVWNHVVGLTADASEKTGSAEARPTASPRGYVAMLPDDDALLDKARRASNGPAFSALYDRGDLGGYEGDASRATAALLAHLAFWTGCDARRMDTLFRGSALMRPKWDARRGDTTWGDNEITRAIERASETYTPGRATASRPAQDAHRPAGPHDPETGARRSEAETEPEAEAYIANGPRIPAAVYDALPDELRVPCRLLREGHERDVFLTGLLPCLTAAMPNVLTRYSRRWKALPIMAAVVAPAGSGKATLQLAAETVAPIDERLRAASQARLDEWQALDKKERDGDARPEYSRLRVAADSSLRAITDALIAGGGRGLIFETEIRVLASSLKQDWGDFKGLLLKAAEQEPYERNRKDDAPTYLRRPELAAAMSGTPRSFTDWMEDAEDGLFSRFLFYAFTAPPVWLNQFEEDEDDALDAALGRIGHRLDGLHRALSDRTLTDADGDPAPLYLILARDQREHVNRTFAALQHAVHGTGRAELLASVKRGAFQAVRIAGALALYRLAATTQGGCAALSSLKSYTPTDAEVRAAVVLVRCYLEHAGLLAVSFAPNPTAKLESEERRRFFEALPDAFETAEALAIGSGMGMSASAVERALKTFTDRHGLVTRLRRGQYRKATPADPAPPPLPSPLTELTEATGATVPTGERMSEAPLPPLPSLPSEPSLPSIPPQGDGLPDDALPEVAPTPPVRFPRGTRVSTPYGPGEVLQHFADRITVALDGHDRTTDLPPHDVTLEREPDPTAPF